MFLVRAVKEDAALLCTSSHGYIYGLANQKLIGVASRGQLSVHTVTSADRSKRRVVYGAFHQSLNR